MKNKEMTWTDASASKAPVSLLDAQEVALIIKFSVKTVHKLVREGKLPCVQVTARERRFTPEQVQQYIESQSTGIRVDKKAAPAVSSRPKKGGEKSPENFGTDLVKEIRSLCR
ncbi:MAG: helix-turn-helix domain-containing protein [Desulfomonilaceae bacterium]